MKKRIVLVLTIIAMLAIVGCNKKNVEITADKAKDNEIIVTKSDKIQSVIKEISITKIMNENWLEIVSILRPHFDKNSTEDIYQKDVENCLQILGWKRINKTMLTQYTLPIGNNNKPATVAIYIVLVFEDILVFFKVAKNLAVIIINTILVISEG